METSTKETQTIAFGDGKESAVHPNGMTEEQVRRTLTLLEQQPPDLEYVERVFGAASEVRRRLDQEFLQVLGAV